MRLRSDSAISSLMVGQEPFLALNRREVFNLLFTVFETALQKSLELERKEKELRKAMDVIRELKEIIHACAHCKRVRDDKDEWRKVESSSDEQRETEYSHTVCPECAEAFYPDFARKNHNPKYFSDLSLEHRARVE